MTNAKQLFRPVKRVVRNALEWERGVEVLAESQRDSGLTAAVRDARRFFDFDLPDASGAQDQ